MRYYAASQVTTKYCVYPAINVYRVKFTLDNSGIPCMPIGYYFNRFRKTPIYTRGHPPLVDSERKIAVFWSPKAGCTFVTKWFFAQQGILEEALDYHPFVHQYRTLVFQKSRKYRRAVRDLLKTPRDYTIIKIVRHPLHRTVSCFIQANITRFADAELSRYLGRELTRDQRFSFAEFISYLESIDLHRCNPHLQLQTHPLESSGKIKPTHVIDLVDSVSALAELEISGSMKKTDMLKLAESEHHTERADTSGFYGDRIISLRRRGNTPPSRNFYNTELVERVGRLYREDFDRYHYECTLDAL